MAPHAALVPVVTDPSYIRQQLNGNPRYSSGSLVPVSHRRRRGSDSSDSECSCNSLPLNTPWSSPPTSTTGSVVSRRGRRASVSERGPRQRSLVRAKSPGRPLIHQDISVRSVSPTRTMKTVIVPASSVRSHRREKRDNDSVAYSTSARSVRSSRSSHYRSYSKPTDQTADHVERGHDFPQAGRTKFPKKLVIRDAVEEKGYPFSVEENGAIVVLQALGRPEIEELVDLSEEIRRRRHSGKAVSFYEKTVVHDIEPLPEAPAPPEPDVLSVSDYSVTPHHNHYPEPNSMSHMSAHGGKEIVVYPTPSAPIPITHNPHQAQDLTVFHHSPPRFEPLGPPGPSAPVPGSIRTIEIAPSFGTSPSSRRPSEKIKKAEEKAARAERIAVIKEERARISRRPGDEYDAWKARSKADNLIRKVEQVEAKERLKMEKRELKRREQKVFGVRVARNVKGEILILEN